MADKLPAYASKAMFVLVLIEGTTPTSLTTSKQVDLWADAIPTPYTIGRDADGTEPFASRAALGPKETAYIVERATGVIVARGDNGLALLPKLDSL